MSYLPYEKSTKKLLTRKNQPFAAPEVPEKSIQELLESSFVIINKPQAPTSHQVSAYVKDIVGASITGHTGTLDPNVTGVLPVAVGRATKIIQALINTGKEYVCYMHVHDELPEEQVRNTIMSFVGEIEQLPPVKSAVKRQLRTRRIYYIDILQIDGKDVLFQVGCQAGTYMRKLCTDIGEKLGCGAHMQQLVRTKAACFSDKDMCTLQELTDAMHFYKTSNDESKLRQLLRPVEDALVHLRKVYVDRGVKTPITHGAQLMVPGIIAADEYIKENELVAIVNSKGELYALAQAILTGKQMIRKSKGQATKTVRVYVPQ